MDLIDVPLQPLTAAAFSPYGWILDAGQKPDYARPGLENWRLPFVGRDTLRLQVMRYSNRNMRLSMFERHINVTEARHPIGNAAAVLVVAGDLTLDGPPSADSIKAFLLDGQKGIMFRQGVWHGLDCFPARTEHVDYLFLSDAATEDEIESQGSPGNGVHTHIFDFAEKGLAFRVIDPKGVLA